MIYRIAKISTHVKCIINTQNSTNCWKFYDEAIAVHICNLKSRLNLEFRLSKLYGAIIVFAVPKPPFNLRGHCVDRRDSLAHWSMYVESSAELSGTFVHYDCLATD
jgi:hypothetical protein